MRPLTVLVASLGCSRVTSESGERVEVVDEGRICIYANQPSGPDMQPQDYMADRPIFVRVEVGGCHSSSCDVDPEASCSVNDSTLEISSYAAWTDRSSTQQACTDDCNILSAVCHSAPLPAGSYAFTFGTVGFGLIIPSQTSMPLCP